jgi:hypothetical protein
LPEQREALEQLVRARSTPQQLALRARIILHAAMGPARVQARGNSVSGPRRCGIGASGDRQVGSGRGCRVGEELAAGIAVLQAMTGPPPSISGRLATASSTRATCT